MTITLPDPDTHCFDEDKTPPADVWSYSPDLVRQIIEADRAQRTTIAPKDCLWARNGHQCCPTTQPAHTEAEVQKLMLCVADWDVERSQYEALVRRILGVPQP